MNLLATWRDQCDSIGQGGSLQWLQLYCCGLCRWHVDASG
jgi:hypothetical protein